MVKNTTIEVLVGDKEEFYALIVSLEEHKRILNGDKELLQQSVDKETEKRSNATIQQLFTNSNEDNQDLENLENVDPTEDNTEKEGTNEKQAVFNWPDKAVMLFLELYRERDHEFNAGLKRYNKLWSEIAVELQKLNYNVSGVQVQNKMSSMKRTYKKIKDANAKSGNHNSSWMFYSTMDSIFGDKAWVSPPATTSSNGPTVLSTLASSSSACCSSPSSSVDNFENQEVSVSKPKKRKVETILESFITDLKSNREQIKEEKKAERIEKEKNGGRDGKLKEQKKRDA